MYNTMLYMSLFWGFAKKSEAKVILHSSAMLKKIKGPFYLINCWMKILNIEASKSSYLLGPFWDLKFRRFSLEKIKTDWVL